MIAHSRILDVLGSVSISRWKTCDDRVIVTVTGIVQSPCHAGLGKSPKFSSKVYSAGGEWLERVMKILTLHPDDTVLVQSVHFCLHKHNELLRQLR